MPSTLLGLPLASGTQLVVSGTLWSGQPPFDVRGFINNQGVSLTWICSASGAVAYTSRTSGFTMTSGGFFLSGQGANDGRPMQPGQSTFYPRPTGLGNQNFSLFANCDAAASGIGRLYWETIL